MQVDDDASGPRSSQLVLQYWRKDSFGDEDGDDDFQMSPSKAIAAAVSDFNKCNKSILPPSKSVLIPSPPSTEDVVPPQVLVVKVVEVNTPPKKTSKPLIFKGGERSEPLCEIWHPTKISKKDLAMEMVWSLSAALQVEMHSSLGGKTTPGAKSTGQDM